LENEALALFREIMAHCKKERKSKTKLSNKHLARELKITENYVSALESARATPSIQVFLKYLIACGFDVDPLSALEVVSKETLRPTSKTRNSLIQKIYTFDEEQLGYLAEQAKLAELFQLKIKSSRRT
jgi:transcriptional regulator with XRE-family HTH domain